MHFRTEHVKQHPHLLWDQRPELLPDARPDTELSALKRHLHSRSSQLSDAFTYLYDYSKRRYSWVSDSYSVLTGFPCENLLNQTSTTLSLHSPRTERIFRRYVLPHYQKELSKLSPSERLGLQVSFSGELVCQDNTVQPFVANLEVLQTDAKGRVDLDFGLIRFLTQAVGEFKFAYRIANSDLQQVHIITESMIPVHAEPRLDDLSTRERQILDLLRSGLNSREIADQLFISSHTVDTHRRKILRKTNFDSTTELINYLRGF